MTSYSPLSPNSLGNAGLALLPWAFTFFWVTHPSENQRKATDHSPYQQWKMTAYLHAHQIMHITSGSHRISRLIHGFSYFPGNFQVVNPYPWKPNFLNNFLLIHTSPKAHKIEAQKSFITLQGEFYSSSAYASVLSFAMYYLKEGMTPAAFDYLSLVGLSLSFKVLSQKSPI